MNNVKWLLCPYCNSKTRTRIRPDTTLTNYPLYCPKCKRDALIDVQQMNIHIIKAQNTTTTSSANDLPMSENA